MITVEDNDENLGLNVLNSFIGNELTGYQWEIFDLEYSGSNFNGSSPALIELKSKEGIKIPSENFATFISTITQVIEGIFILRAKNAENVPSREEQGALIKILICDGSFWEIGGELAVKFIDAVGLTRI